MATIPNPQRRGAGTQHNGTVEQLRPKTEEDMRIEPETSGVSVVVLGTFNPAIFTPAWFELHGVLPGVEARAELKVAHAQVTAFTFDWLRLDVVVERLAVATTEAPYVRLCDLVARTFKEFLPHTPLRAFGINRDVHFPVQSPAEADRIGRALAPVEPWGAVGRDIGFDGKHGGMTSLTMSQLCPEGRPTGGAVNVKVEPSKRLSPGLGVFVSVNDHYALEGSSSGTADSLMGTLCRNFDESLSRSDRIIDHVMSLASHPEK